MLLAVRISSYGCTWEVWRTLKKLELFSAAPRATLTLLSCSLNFPRASITRYTHAKHETILNCTVASSYCEPKGERKDCFKKTILVLSVHITSGRSLVGIPGSFPSTHIPFCLHIPFHISCPRYLFIAL